MVRASALYIVIVIALVIGVICATLVASAYFYRIQHAREARYNLLQNNVGSAVNYLLAGHTEWDTPKKISLFGKDNDSVQIEKKLWGVYDMGIVRAFIQSDTLYKVFTMAHPVDSAKWAVLYLIDEDRSLSVSGKTMINGNAFVPKSGIRTAYVENKPYSGDKRIITGHQYNSDKQLPPLKQDRLQLLNKFQTDKHPNDSLLLKDDSVYGSFLKATRFIQLKKRPYTLQNIKLEGNIVILSDTLITVDSTALLKNVIVFARAIVVKSGFKGNCQLFASDSVSIGRRCRFDYPSCAGIIRLNESKGQEILRLSDQSSFSGLLFTYEQKSRPQMLPFIELGKNTTVSGQIYAQGTLGLHDGVVVNGSAFTSRFFYQSTYTRYENYLINTKLDMAGLSRYYLAPDVVPVTRNPQKIMQWLEQN
ncbi:hypothetical protein HQ865_15250 [Mucilaginibacter mali]|uniref:Uncharacterized protein n=1 Tax=Mucilaginibacter mali TaxID=2740462 RepID=A0A7D4QGH1_9SPHI|nr:hypothetical protein [Mucilaginibacter mali]QKJ31052.1 hypothetical protein HQ865_15250 [Mucilaginibacter mali]